MMRTYTRKRPDNQLIEDVQELCRLCLNKAMEVIPIFSEGTDNVCATLALRIMICVGLEVKREDCLPNVVCAECYSELNKYYAFRKKCEVTYQKLKSHVLAVKEKQFKQKQAAQDEAEKLKKLEEDDEELKFVVTFDKDQITEANVLNLNGVAQVNNFVEQKLPDLPSVDITEFKMPNQNTEILQEESKDEDTSQEPDVTTFLSTMLIELGILTRQDDELVFSNQNIKTLELETGDGSQIMLQLMEEDESQVDMQETENTPFEVAEMNEEDADVKYIISNPITKKHILEDLDGRCILSKSITKKQIVAENNSGHWCEVCGKRLASRSALARHMRVHSGEKPYACKKCDRRFAQREVLLRHVLVHEKNRPYQCTECEKSFTQRGALLSHSRAHAPPDARPLRLFRCSWCPKVFLHASGLSRHIMTHNGRVYVCGGCDRQFKDKSSLRRHIKNTKHAPKDKAPT